MNIKSCLSICVCILRLTGDQFRFCPDSCTKSAWMGSSSPMTAMLLANDDEEGGGEVAEGLDDGAGLFT